MNGRVGVQSSLSELYVTTLYYSIVLHCLRLQCDHEVTHSPSFPLSNPACLDSLSGWHGVCGGFMEGQLVVRVGVVE